MPEANKLLASLHSAEGLEYVRAGAAENATLRIRNTSGNTIALDGESRITVDFGEDVTFDDAKAEGFRSAREGGRLILTSTRRQRWWSAGEMIEVELPSFRANDSGVGVVTVDAGQAGGATFALVKLGASGGNATAEWLGDATVTAAAANTAVARAQLPLRVGGASRILVALSSGNAGTHGLLADAADAADIDFDAPDGWSVRRFDTTLPAWELTSAGGATSAEITLRRVRGRARAGTAHLFVYTLGNGGDAVAVLPVQLVTGSVSIVSFSSDVQVLRNITAPATVYLSWQTENATTVTLSGAGVVDLSQSRYAVTLEQTTTFVLTAYDSALDSIVSSAVTVTVDPPFSSRLVPIGTIALWNSAELGTPDGWEPCDGEEGRPDLRDRFVMGAGGSAASGTSGDADTHTHQVPAQTVSARTSYQGSHSHKFPSVWYDRKFEGGDYTGIDTNGTFNPNDPPTQDAGGHDHTVSVPFPAVGTGTNIGDVRPPWCALLYMIKVR